MTTCLRRGRGRAAASSLLALLTLLSVTWVAAAAASGHPRGVPSGIGARPEVEAAPLATLTASLTAAPLAGPPVLTVTFTGHARGGNLSGPYNFTWNFGDGTPPRTDSVVSTPPETNDTVVHAYGQVGNYTTTLTVDDQGAIASASVLIRVTAQLLLSATAVPAVITLGETSILTANVSGGVAPYTFSWSGVPPGCLVRANTLTCSPTLPGNFSILAQVVDSAGATATATLHLLVNPPIVVAAGVSSRYLCEAGTGAVTVNLTGGAHGGTPPYTFYWNPGDGGPNVSGAVVPHTYPLGGVYNATLTVYDVTGAKASAVAKLTTSLPACSPTSTVPYFGPPQYLVVGVSAVAVVTGGLLYWEWRQRTRKGPVAPPGGVSGEPAGLRPWQETPPPPVGPAPVPPAGPPEGPPPGARRPS